jgi:hypothetical protein
VVLRALALDLIFGRHANPDADVLREHGLWRFGFHYGCLARILASAILRVQVSGFDQFQATTSRLRA